MASTSTSTTGTSRFTTPPRLRLYGRALLVVVGLAWTLGLVRFVRTPARVTLPLPKVAEHPADEHNLVSFRFGPKLTVSSYFKDPFSPHHPAFLVDGKLSPVPVEKWSSLASDAHPFVRLEWDAPKTLERVVVKHAGAHEDPALSVNNYKLSCLRPAPAPELVVTGNQAATAIHAFSCADARGIRIDFHPPPGTPARIYEIEAWGR